MLTEEIVMSLTEGLSILNEEIKKDKSTLDFLQKTIQYQTSKTHNNSQSLEDVIDAIYGPPTGAALELIITGEREELEEYIEENKHFYLSIRENFRYAFLASVRSYNFSPYALMHVEPVTNEKSLFRFLRADSSYFDIDLDTFSFTQLNSLSTNALFSLLTSEDTDED